MDFISAFRGLTFLFALSVLAGAGHAQTVIPFHTDVTADPIVFDFDNAGTDPITDDTLTADVTGLRLGVDLTSLGGGLIFFDDASFTMTASLTSVTLQSVFTVTLLDAFFDGSFTVRDTNGTDLLHGAFAQMQLAITALSPSVVTVEGTWPAPGLSGASLDLQAGPGLQGLLDPWALATPSQMAFTALSVEIFGDGNLGWQDFGGGAVRIDNFQATGHVAGETHAGETVLTPEPTSLATLVALGGALWARQRRVIMRRAK